jgi:hypothetical protein
MRSGWRIRIVTAILAVLTGPLVGCPAHASVGSVDGPQLIVVSPPVVQAGVATWMSAYWLTWVDVCDARVTVSGPGVTVTYPASTGSYSSFSRDSSLAAGQADYTAFRVTTGPVRGALVTLRLHLSYTRPDPGSPMAACHGRTSGHDFPVAVSVLAVRGALTSAR